MTLAAGTIIFSFANRFDANLPAGCSLQRCFVPRIRHSPGNLTLKPPGQPNAPYPSQEFFVLAEFELLFCVALWLAFFPFEEGQSCTLTVP